MKSLKLVGNVLETFRQIFLILKSMVFHVFEKSDLTRGLVSDLGL